MSKNNNHKLVNVILSLIAVLYPSAGQFQHADISVTAVKEHVDEGLHRAKKEEILARGVLRWGSEQVPVTLQDKKLKDSVQKVHLGRCWVVPKTAIERLLGHSYGSYVVNHV